MFFLPKNITPSCKNSKWAQKVIYTLFAQRSSFHNYIQLFPLVCEYFTLLWQGSLDVNPGVLISSFLVEILPYGLFPCKWS